MTSTAIAAARLKAAFGPCQHRNTDDVVTVMGETVAEICVDCLDGPLPIGWKHRVPCPPPPPPGVNPTIMRGRR